MRRVMAVLMAAGGAGAAGDGGGRGLGDRRAELDAGRRRGRASRGWSIWRSSSTAARRSPAWSRAWRSRAASRACPRRDRAPRRPRRPVPRPRGLPGGGQLGLRGRRRVQPRAHLPAGADRRRRRRPPPRWPARPATTAGPGSRSRSPARRRCSWPRWSPRSCGAARRRPAADPSPGSGVLLRERGPGPQDHQRADGDQQAQRGRQPGELGERADRGRSVKEPRYPMLVTAAMATQAAGHPRRGGAEHRGASAARPTPNSAQPARLGALEGAATASALPAAATAPLPCTTRARPKRATRRSPSRRRRRA